MIDTKNTDTNSVSNYMPPLRRMPLVHIMMGAMFSIVPSYRTEKLIMVLVLTLVLFIILYLLRVKVRISSESIQIIKSKATTTWLWSEVKRFELSDSELSLSLDEDDGVPWWKYKKMTQGRNLRIPLDNIGEIIELLPDTFSLKSKLTEEIEVKRAEGKTRAALYSVCLIVVLCVWCLLAAMFKSAAGIDLFVNHLVVIFIMTITFSPIHYIAESLWMFKLLHFELGLRLSEALTPLFVCYLMYATNPAMKILMYFLIGLGMVLPIFRMIVIARAYRREMN